MFRKSLHLVLLLVFLVPALTGWAGDYCCPDRDDPCGTSCADAGAAPGSDAEHARDGDPAHEQALCGCATCQLHVIGGTVPSLGAPSPIGTLDPQDSEDPSNAHLSDIFRPPLA